MPSPTFPKQPDEWHNFQEPSPTAIASGLSEAQRACDYANMEWACRGEYLWDTDGDGYDPHDASYPCPKCNTREYLETGVENAMCLSSYQWVETSGAEQWRARVEIAMAANPTTAAAALADIGPVECLDWIDPEAPDWNRTVTVIENTASAPRAVRQAIIEGEKG